MLNEVRDDILYKITLEELPPMPTWVASPEDEYYCSKKLHPAKEVKYFHDKEEVITFLFDKDLFGWEVKGWQLNDPYDKYTQLHIELYRFNCD